MTLSSKRLAIRFLSHTSILAVTIVAFLPVTANAALALPAAITSIILDAEPEHRFYATPGGTFLNGLEANVIASPAPTVFGEVFGRSDGMSSSMSAGLTYSYGVDRPIDAPPIDLIVPLFATFRIFASASGGAPGAEILANATLSIHGVNGTSINRVVIAQSCCGPLEFNGTLSFAQLSGHFDRVEISVAVSASAGAGFSAYATATVDPYIFIDPAWLADHPNYSVAVSAGIGNAAPGVAAIPEPQTYAMMLAGLGLLGFVARRRKNKTA